MRWVAILVAATLTGPALRPATAQQSAGPGVPLAELLNAGFEIKGAVLAGILVQNGPLPTSVRQPSASDRWIGRACH